jgi:DNA polymerase-4
LKIEAGVLQMTGDVWRWCQGRHSFGRTVTVKITYADFQQITRSRSQPDAVSTHENLRKAALDLVRSVLPANKGIRLVGVTVSNFAETGGSATGDLPIFAKEVVA